MLLRGSNPWRAFGLSLAVGFLLPTTANASEAAEAAPATHAPAAIDYNRDIRPILSNACYTCHGPDEAAREAGLRLDRHEDAIAQLDSGQRAIVPGEPRRSELLQRITHADPARRMPPVESDKQLSPDQIDLLQRWIASGAAWRGHWSFIPPQRSAIPKVTNTAWPRNPVDHFILDRLEREQLPIAPEADKATLLRRVTLDLTGLPPTLAELDAFLADESPEAYERVVDRLLASPRYGERLALEWLDAARYADTNGFHIDNARDMWPWRDWVIGAFNRNLPFDQFTIEQLAGDLLPNATREQQLASGFHRNHMINFEGGAIAAEYLNAYIVDRVSTTGTVWLGLTLGCAQCHDHKYDPITQREFYQLYAFFNNIDEKGLDGRQGNSQPLVRLATDEQAERLERLTSQITTLQEKLLAPDEQLDTAQLAWETMLSAGGRATWHLLEPSDMQAAGGALLHMRSDGTIVAEGNNPPQETYTIAASLPQARLSALRLDVLSNTYSSHKGPGRSENGNFVLTGVRASLRHPDGQLVELPLSRAAASHSQKDFPVAATIDDDTSTGWAILPEINKLHWAIFCVEMPGESAAATETIDEADSATAATTATASSQILITLEFHSKYPQHQFARFKLSVTELPYEQIEVLPTPIERILAVKPDKRSEEQRNTLQTHYRSSVSAEHRRLHDEVTQLRGERNKLQQLIPTAMVMRELDKPRETFLLVRGEYDKPGEQVTAALPTALPGLPADTQANRLALARWLVADEHPLTARVTVNRYWQMIFGVGLVRTSEDFGSQGEWPSHEELLDWLARDFVDSGWDVKRLLRTLVTSATYRQSASTPRERYGLDPENRLLARGPRFRLQAELVRDLALSASGLLTEQIGGPSVSPYQPPGLWEEMANGRGYTAQRYEQSQGADLYRRGMYTFWKRTVPPASLATFDAPDREVCTVRRSRTNTPLQALVLLNDPTYVEAARKLAERVIHQGGPTTTGRLDLLYRLCLSRLPRDAERATLERLLTAQQARFTADPTSATRLLSVGESPRDKEQDPAELAAWTLLCSAVLNLDETINK